MALPSEDSTCAICDDSEGENSNAIVFCDGCNLAVHQGAKVSNSYKDVKFNTTQIAMGCHISQRVSGSAASVPFLPRFLWQVFILLPLPSRPCWWPPKSCVLCPNEGGAFKQTIHGEWVHLLCAIWVPETRVANEVFMEPITGLDKVSKQRWKLVRHIICRNGELQLTPRS